MGGAVLQRVQKKNLLFHRFSERLDSFFAVTLIDVSGVMCVGCAMHLRACCQGTAEHTHTHTSTPAGTILHTHTHTQTKGRKGDQRKMK